MATFYELPVIDAPRQRWNCVLNGRRCEFDLAYNPTTQRWSFDLRVDDTLVLAGRRIVTGIDLLQPFDFGIGRLIAWPMEKGAEPGRTELPSGRVRLFNVVD